MKRFSVLIASIMMVSAMQAAEKLDLKAITSGEFSASYVTGINPIEELISMLLSAMTESRLLVIRSRRVSRWLCSST